MDKDGLCTYPCSTARSLAKALAWFEPTCVTSKSVHRASDFSALTSSHHRCIGRAGWLDWTELGLWHQGSTSAGWCCWWWQWVKKYSALHCDALVRVQDYRRGPCWLSPWSTLLLKQGLVRIVEWRTSGKHSPVTNRWQETHKVILATLGQATSHQKSGRWFNSCAGLNWDCGYPPKWTLYLVRIFLAVRRGIPSPAPGACLQAAGSPKNLCHKDKTLWHFQF